MSDLKNIAYLSCKTSHGGVIKTGNIGATVQNQFPIACVGDLVSCPIHGDNAISPTTCKLMIDGKFAARDGDLTACGSKLIVPDMPGGADEGTIIFDVPLLIIETNEAAEAANNPNPEPLKYDQKVEFQNLRGKQLKNRKYHFEYQNQTLTDKNTENGTEIEISKETYPHDFNITFTKSK